ncbi:MAG: glutamate racemase [Bacteroidota bacterium]
MKLNADPHHPIGVFDSGIGGLTVAKALNHHLPEESIIYFGDTAHLPYGDKSADAIRYYAIKIAKFLLDRQCKIIVIACNSASTTAYDVLVDFFDDRILFVNVVDPLVEAVQQHNFKKVGVIATKATISTGTYSQKLKALSPATEVVSMATPLLVPMIEEGFFQNHISQSVIEQYLGNPDFADIEALLLACTHYPLIRPDIEAFFNHQVKVFDSTDVVAAQVHALLDQHQLHNQKKTKAHQFFVSDFTHSFEETTKLFYQEQIELEHCPIWKN